MKQPLQSDDSDVYEDFKAGLKSEEGKKRSDSDIARSANDDPKLCSKKARVSLAKVDRHDGKKRRRIFQQGAPPRVVESDSEYEVEEVIELCEWYPPDFWKSGLNLKVKIGGPLLSYYHCPNSASSVSGLRQGLHETDGRHRLRHHSHPAGESIQRRLLQAVGSLIGCPSELQVLQLSTV